PGMGIETFHLGTEMSEQFAHGTDIAQVGDVLDDARLVRQECRRKDWQSGVFGAADFNRPPKRTAPPDPDNIHTKASGETIRGSVSIAGTPFLAGGGHVFSRRGWAVAIGALASSALWFFGTALIRFVALIFLSDRLTTWSGRRALFGSEQ